MSDTILDVAGQSDASQITDTTITDQGQQTAGQDEAVFHDWTGQVKKDALIDDLKGHKTITDFVKHFQGVKAELDTVKSGLEGFVKVPGEKSTPEEVAAYKKAHGIPESADKYEFKLDELPEGIALDEKAITDFKQFAYENNLPPAVAEAVLKLDIERRGQEYKASQEAKKEKALEGVKLLKDKHGEKFNEKLTHALRIVEKIGGAELKEEINANYGNSPELVNFLMTVSGHFTEDGVLTGDSSGSGKTSIDDLYPKMKEYYK